MTGGGLGVLVDVRCTGCTGVLHGPVVGVRVTRVSIRSSLLIRASCDRSVDEVGAVGGLPVMARIYFRVFLVSNQ